MYTYAGIDLGFSGAIAVISSEGKVVDIQEIPTLKVIINKKERNAFDVSACSMLVFNLLSTCDMVFVEKVQPVMAKFGASSGASNFHLGYCLGMFQMAMETMKVRYELVKPKEWQKHFGIIRPKDDDKWNTKGAAYQVAKGLFPDAELTTKRGRVLDGRSDALLIAEYGKRKITGGCQGDM